MSTNDLLAFVDRLNRSGLLDAARLQQVTRKLLPASADAEALARHLIARRWLTAPQARELLAGRPVAAPAAPPARGVPWAWLAAAVVLAIALVVGTVALLRHRNQVPDAAGAVAARDDNAAGLDGKLRRLADDRAPAPQAPTAPAPARPALPTAVSSRPTPQPPTPPPPAPPTTSPASPPPEKPAPPPPPPTPPPVPPLGGAWLAVTPDGKILASGNGAVVRLWDVVAGKVIRTIISPQGYGFTSLALSPDGKTLATGTSRSQTDNPVVLWDAASGRMLKALNPVPVTNYVTATPAQGSFIGPGISWGPMKLPTGPASSVAFSPNGRTVATAGSGGNASNGGDGMLHLYDVASGRNTAALGYTPIPNAFGNVPPLPGLNVVCVTCTPDGKSIISGGTDGILRWWDTRTGKNYATRSDGTTGATVQVALSPDGKTLASWKPWGKEIRLWDAVRGTSLPTLTTDYGISTVAFSPDGKTLASGGGGWDAKQPTAELKLWNVASGQNAATLKEPTDPVNAVVFSPDGKTLFTQSDQDIKLWEVASGQCIKTLGR